LVYSTMAQASEATKYSTALVPNEYFSPKDRQQQGRHQKGRKTAERHQQRLPRVVENLEAVAAGTGVLES